MNVENLDTKRTPTRIAAAIFAGKAAALQTRRAARDIAGRVRRHPTGALWPHVIAEARSPLWNLPGDAALAELALQAGKVQNLRVAAKSLNGARIGDGAVFSFWKQVGRATRGRGFASGRLLREGCLMPAIGGGLCQLSNALYDAALNAGLEIVERWAHSRVVPDSAAQCGRDATVAWNYIDLRFRADFEWQIEAVLTRDELVVRLRTAIPRTTIPQKVAPLIPLESLFAPRLTLDMQEHSCASCGEDKCFRHIETDAQSTPVFGRTFWVLDGCQPELETFRAQRINADDGVLLARRGAKPQSLWRSLAARRWKKHGARRLKTQLQNDASIARALAKQIPPDARHLIVAQSLLPFLWREGVLGGRRFDVLMTRLPLEELHHKLDAALQQFPDRATLGEFRAPHQIAADESAALAAAEKLVTTHAAIAALFGERAARLGWNFPSRSPAHASGTFALFFPGPTAARKGAYEVREAARALGCAVLLAGNAQLEGDDFWRGVRTRCATEADWCCSAHVVVQPAIVEDNPRVLLAALAHGMGVVATSACGLDAHPNLFLVPESDAAALIEVLLKLRDEQARIA